MPPATSLQKLSANWMTIPRSDPSWMRMFVRKLKADLPNLLNPALEAHAAQLAASQSADGSAPSASAAIASAAQRKLKGQKQTTTTLQSSMPTVPEEAAPPSDQESFRSANEQSEPVPEE
eukprot:553829-Amphidinium_carterae.1